MTSATPPPAPQGNLIKLDSSESEPDLDPFDPFAGPRLQKLQNKDSGFRDLAVLQDSSANATTISRPATGLTIMNLFYTTADGLRTPDPADGSETSPGFHRGESGRSSLIRRTNAFRNPSQEGPVRVSSVRDNDVSSENLHLDLDFDPLAAPTTAPQQTGGVGVGKASTDKDSPPSFMQDWSHTILGGMAVPAPQQGPMRHGPPPAPPKPHDVPSSASHANPVYFTSPPPMPKPRTSMSNPLYTPPRQSLGTSNPLHVPPSKSLSGSSVGSREVKPDPFAELAPLN